MRAACTPRLFALIAAACLSSACHSIELAAPANPSVAGPRSELTASIEVEPDSRELRTTMGGTSAGLAHRFEVEVGATLERFAKAYCARAFAAGEELHIRVEIESFELVEGAGELVTKFRVERAGELIFSPRYVVQGPPRPGLPGHPNPEAGLPGGADDTSQLKESLRRTLHDVLTLTCSHFFEELRAQL